MGDCFFCSTVVRRRLLRFVPFRLTLECIPKLIILMVQPKTGTGFRSGSLAKAAGVSADTIRHYERIGVLPKAARTSTGYRIYPETALERVRVIQSALRMGFSLAELAEVLKTRDAGGAPCRRVYELAQQKLQQVAMDIQTLKRTEKYLQQVLSDWDDRMRGSRSDRAYLLHSLPDGVEGCVRRPTMLKRKVSL